MTVHLARQDDAFHMQATNALGQTASLDGAPDIGGHDRGLRPMQMVLASLGACSSIDVILILKKQRQQLTDLKMRVDAEREEGKVPSLFTKIHVHYDCYGPDLKENRVARAVKLSMEEYCSVAKMLEKQCPITYSFAIHAG